MGILASPCAGRADGIRDAVRLTHNPGVDFEAAWQRRLSVTLDGVTIP